MMLSYPPPWSYYKSQGQAERYVVRDSRYKDLLETWDEELADGLCQMVNSFPVLKDIDMTQIVVVKQGTGMLPLHYVVGNPTS